MSTKTLREHATTLLAAVDVLDAADAAKRDLAERNREVAAATKQHAVLVDAVAVQELALQATIKAGKDAVAKAEADARQTAEAIIRAAKAEAVGISSAAVDAAKAAKVRLQAAESAQRQAAANIAEAEAKLAEIRKKADAETARLEKAQATIASMLAPKA